VLRGGDVGDVPLVLVRDYALCDMRVRDFVWERWGQLITSLSYHECENIISLFKKTLF
jgi:hypothetical protein